MVAAALAGYLRYRKVWSSIHRVDVSRDLHHDARPPQYTGALNVLLIGSDSRAGSNRRFGAGIQGQRSDTIMLLHISPGHRGAVVLSIPRDSMAPILSCAPEEPGTAGQHPLTGQRERINQTFANGGPGCLWKTVEYETGIRIDHFIELTFTGFEHIINDIGGVNICLPVPVDDPDSKLRLSAGMHHVGGAQALAFWRERHIGAGSDLQRIARDQYLMAALVREIRHADILGDPTRLYSIVVDAASAMTTDSRLNMSTMLRIADSLKGVVSSSVQFVTVPEVPYPGDPQAEVSFQQPQARHLFHAVAHDTKLPRPHRRKLASHASSAGSSLPSGHSPPLPLGDLTRIYGGISGAAPSCADRSAFAGGDVPADFPSP